MKMIRKEEIELKQPSAEDREIHKEYMAQQKYRLRVAKRPCPRCAKVGRQIYGGSPRCFNMDCPVGYYYEDGSHKPKLWDGYGGK